MISFFKGHRGELFCRGTGLSRDDVYSFRAGNGRGGLLPLRALSHGVLV